MITVKHPNESCNEAQERLLDTCPESMRRFHELLFTYGNITFRYHIRGQGFATEELWLEWLEGLPDAMRMKMKSEGFEACRTAIPFTRYISERNDEGLTEYVLKYMDPSDYQEYLDLVK